MPLDELDVAPGPRMPMWILVRCGMSIGGTEAMSMALNQSGYRYFGGLAAFAVALSDVLDRVIHNPCHRVYSGRPAREGKLD